MTFTHIDCFSGPGGICTGYDDRQFLFREGIRIAQLSKAKLLLFENVPAIASKKVSRQSSQLIVEVLKAELKQIGYGNFIEVVMNAAHYGVPQRRNRFFILACRYSDWALSFPIPTREKAAPVSEALAGLPNVFPNSGKEMTAYENTESAYAGLMRDDTFWKRGDGICRNATYQMPMKHRACTLERFALLNPGESLKEKNTARNGIRILANLKRIGFLKKWAQPANLAQSATARLKKSKRLPKKRQSRLRIDLDFKTFKAHAVKAADYWLAQRQWFNSEWSAEVMGT
ncbi:MAG: DNA cytosine methyltransferase [Clostridiales Family XIII bacterium]|jgi:DNA (cytosine-5)-methyltransferase 1|nr:DNA cytosine methyltransferase [Clostridiales Family XIII bacterium]